ncbi:MAG: 4-hydroxyphenylacetate decarboxylase small subunit [Chloroflexi bacterium]|nr:4-hydroxyphenylacetate decarboxylase small subunit [Chloroflexota bacterium]MBU1751106.1 4-hydroxyphenylacetate decarboxylase small subunit [Chloroflexota bacterium]
MSKHLDCRNFAPVDVAKGICHIRKEIILADGKSCEFFEKLPKCKHCAHYTRGEKEYLGVCEAEKARPITYPDLASVTCESFAWREA